MDDMEFWYGECNMTEDGLTPVRPTRCCGWASPDGFPSVDRPYVWSGQ